MSWQQFRAEVRTRGLAKSSKYRVEIPFPTTNLVAANLGNLFCESTSLPGFNIATTPHRMYGEVREMPYEPMYDPVSMSFYVDAQLTIKTLFDEWMKLIINPDTRHIQYYNNFVRPVSLFSVTVDGQEPYKITLFEAYPKTIGSIQLSADGRDIIRLPVTFQYKYYKVEHFSITARKITPVVYPNSPSQGIFSGSTFPGLPQLPF